MLDEHIEPGDVLIPTSYTYFGIFGPFVVVSLDRVPCKTTLADILDQDGKFVARVPLYVHLLRRKLGTGDPL